MKRCLINLLLEHSGGKKRDRLATSKTMFSLVDCLWLDSSSVTLSLLISDALSQQRSNYLIRIFFCLSYWLKTPGYFFKTSHRLSNLEYFCWDNVMFTSNCPRRDFAQKAKSRGGTLVTRAYIKGSTNSWNIQSYSQYRKNPDLLEQGPRGGTLVTRAYIKGSTNGWNIQSYRQYRKNPDLLEQGLRGIGGWWWRFYCLRPQVRNG